MRRILNALWWGLWSILARIPVVAMLVIRWNIRSFLASTDITGMHGVIRAQEITLSCRIKGEIPPITATFRYPAGFDPELPEFTRLPSCIVRWGYSTSENIPQLEIDPSGETQKLSFKIRSVSPDQVMHYLAILQNAAWVFVTYMAPESRKYMTSSQLDTLKRLVEFKVDPDVEIDLDQAVVMMNGHIGPLCSVLGGLLSIVSDYSQQRLELAIQSWS